MKTYDFLSKDVFAIRKDLLLWFDVKKRSLPWREASKCHTNQHAYAVWVSEIMLQQTQVSVVIDYYKRWMDKWPTVESLSNATEEEVNEMWSGLGYYSRGRRLLQGAKNVVNNFKGTIPVDSGALKELPGVGRYTAAAISSIVFNEPIGLLDGNVTRVLCRLRAIGGNPSSAKVNTHLWHLSDSLVDPERPGDFNQALMELGATICTPKSPRCMSCPIRFACHAYLELDDYVKKSKESFTNSNTEKNLLDTTNDNSPTRKLSNFESDIEDCIDCLSFPPGEQWSFKLGVENYPRKSKKKPPRLEKVVVCVIECFEKCDVKSRNNHSSQFLIFRRPKKGLLAGMWEFPSEVKEVGSPKPTITMNKKRKRTSDNLSECSSSSIKDVVKQFTNTLLRELKREGAQVTNRRYVGEVSHIFSHIHQTNFIEYVKVICSNVQDVNLPVLHEYRWISLSDFEQVAKSSAVMKILDLVSADKTCKKSKEQSQVRKTQTSIKSYFKTNV